MSIYASVGRLGVNRDPDVRKVQSLLNNHTSGLGLPTLKMDGQVGTKTIAAIEAYQRKIGMARPDGLVEPSGRTIKALTGGAAPGPVTPPKPVPAEAAADWPPKPAFPPLVSDDQRATRFGKFESEWDPQPDGQGYGYETIKVKGNWAATNIVTVKVDMGPTVGTRRMQVHKLTVKQMEGVWKAWKEAGLLDRVLGFAGAYATRYVRVSKADKAAKKQPKTLSNHAFGSAFDINVPWNDLGKVPALVGQKGSVRELVAIAHEWGFYWGGHFSRLDGMHFEIAKLI
jgi:peptidoglycan hydrolase-like protein with peptidoglycan-binding domain